MGIMAGIGGLVGGLGAMFGGSGMPTAPQGFQMPNMYGAANNAYNSIGNLAPFTNMAQSSVGPAMNTFQNLYNNPYAGMLQSGANTASGLGMGAALTGYGTGAGLIGQGQGLFNAGQSVMNTAFDPQSQLYGYLQNQNVNQQNAINAASGLAATPYGAGVTGQSNQLFNMNWQNQQLGRQVEGLQAYTGAAGQGAALQNTGVGMMNAAPGQYATAAAMPYGAASTIGQGQNAAISQMLGLGTSGANLTNLPFSDYMSYLQTGNQANSVSNQLYGLQLQAQNQQFNQMLGLGSLIGGSMYGLGGGLGYGGSQGSMLGNMLGFGGGLGGTYVNGMQVPAGSINYTPLQQSILAGYG